MNERLVSQDRTKNSDRERLDDVYRKILSIAKDMDITYGVEGDVSTSVPIVSIMNDVMDKNFKEFADVVKDSINNINNTSNASPVSMNYTSGNNIRPDQIDIYIE